MAELKRIAEEVPSSELASAAFPTREPEGPKLVKGPEPETLDKATEISKPVPLFSESEMGDFRSQWSKVQTGFVDEPRRTVEGYQLVCEVLADKLLQKRHLFEAVDELSRSGQNWTD
jgi:hypothetical protein